MKIRSISYIHDPEAAEKWFQLVVELVKEEMVKQVNTVMGDEGREEEVPSDKQSRTIAALPTYRKTPF